MSDNFPEYIQTTTKDGVSLTAGIIRPPGTPRGVILAGHAMMVNIRSLDRPAGDGFLSHLARRGYLVLAADLRGHGRSGTPASNGGDWTYDDLVFQDTPALLDLAHQEADGLPVILIGHSLFAHASLAWLGQNPDRGPQAMVLVASNLWLRQDEKNMVKRLKKEMQIIALDLFSRIYGYFPARRIKMGPEDEAAGYIRQFLKVYRQSRWGNCSGTIDFRAGLSQVETPLLLVSGKADQLWCSPEAVHLFHAAIPEQWKTIWAVGKNDYGLDFDPGHMDILTNNRSAPLWEAMADWIEKQI